MAFGNFWTGYECCVTTRLFLPNNTMSNNVNHAPYALTVCNEANTIYNYLHCQKSLVYVLQCYFTTKGSIETIYIYIL